MSVGLCHVCGGSGLVNMGPVERDGEDVTELCKACDAHQIATAGTARRRAEAAEAVRSSDDLMQWCPELCGHDD